MRALVVVLSLLIGFSGFAQNIPIKRQIQVSGILITGDSLKAVKGASIKITKTDSIDYSYFFSVPTDENGFFILMAKPGDILGFRKEGFSDTSYVIPDTTRVQKISIMQQINASNKKAATTSKK